MDNRFSLSVSSQLILLMKKIRTYRKAAYLIMLSTLATITINAQATNEKVQMADGMRSSGKIYVVVAVLLTVLAGLILYVVKLDKKITRLEKQAR